MMNQVVKTKTGFSSYSVEEHWTSESKDAILQEFERIERNYPLQGYGTSLYNLREDPTGLLWHAEFYRYTSCD